MPRAGRSRRRAARAGAAPARISLARKCGYALLPLVAVFALAEGVCRMFPHEARGPVSRAGLVIPDPELIWRLNPALTGALATNELGLRDLPYNAAADVKVLLLGDSVSWGDKLGDDLRKGLAYVLEEELNRRLAPRSVEVINAGVPGYSTFQEAAYLRLRGLTLEPDAVILQFCLNDVVERYSTLTAFGGDNVFLGVDTRRSVTGLAGPLVRHSRAFEALFRFLQSRSRRREEYEVEKLAQDVLSPELDAAWRTVLDELDGIRRLTDERGIPLLIAIAPYRFQLRDPVGLRQPQDRILAYLRQHGLPYVDLLPTFAAARGSSPFIDANHFSHTGHRLAGLSLVDPLTALLGSDGPPAATP